MGADVVGCGLGVGGFALTRFYFNTEFSVILWGMLQTTSKVLPWWMVHRHVWFFFFHAVFLTHLLMETSPRRGKKIPWVSVRLSSLQLIGSLQVSLHWEGKSDILLQTLNHLSAWGSLPWGLIRAKFGTRCMKQSELKISTGEKDPPRLSNPTPESPMAREF